MQLKCMTCPGLKSTFAVLGYCTWQLSYVWMLWESPGPFLATLNAWSLKNVWRRLGRTLLSGATTNARGRICTHRLDFKPYFFLKSRSSHGGTGHSIGAGPDHSASAKLGAVATFDLRYAWVTQGWWFFLQQDVSPCFIDVAQHVLIVCVKVKWK